MKYPEYLELSLKNFSPAILKAFKKIPEKDFNLPDFEVNFGHRRNRGGYKYEKIGHTFGSYQSGEPYLTIQLKKL